MRGVRFPGRRVLFLFLRVGVCSVGDKASPLLLLLLFARLNALCALALNDDGIRPEGRVSSAGCAVACL